MAFCATTDAAPRPADAALVADYLTHLVETGRKEATINVAVSVIAAAHRMMAAWAPAMLHDLLLRSWNYFAVWVNLATGGVRMWRLDMPSLAAASGLSPKERQPAMQL